LEQAFFKRDESYDGLFFAAVTTTGIFCRPVCPARKPRRENVRFFASAREALFAGFRPCRRCHPLEAAGTMPDWIALLVERVEREPATRIREQDLRAMGIEPARVRRFFQGRYGLTFHAFCRAMRMGRAFEQIREGGCIDDAVVDQGFESHSGFRDAFSRVFGAPPGRSHGADFIRFAWIETPLGPMVAGATSRAVCLLEFTERRMLEAQLATLARRLELPAIPGNNAVLEQLSAELTRYFAGSLTRFEVPLLYPGTPFQASVWEQLLTIPYGRTRSYRDIAASIGQPGAVRAVGTANGANRIAIVIPCHRVVNADGQLGGYGGGLWRKRMLLDLEQGQRTIVG
jgi:AraC family transcriptional regulator of adaptative response/methylated-DNA-[protein]-cysteine methyltransferase